MHNELTREPIGRAIQVFAVEFNHLCRNLSDDQLHSLRGMGGIISQYSSDIREQGQDAADLLHLAFSVVDEQVNPDWKKVLDATNDQFCLSQPGWPNRPRRSVEPDS